MGRVKEAIEKEQHKLHTYRYFSNILTILVIIF